MVFAPQQDNYLVKISCSYIKDAIVIKAEITESISELFTCHLFLHTNSDLNIDTILNQSASISIGNRSFIGIISHASFENVPNINTNKVENLLYIKLVPEMEKLKYVRRNKIYQNKTIKEIIEATLQNNKISNYKFSLLKFNNLKLSFCVQYEETDFHFFSRILEEYGLFYYFIGKELIITNNNLAGEKLEINLHLIKSKHKEIDIDTQLKNLTRERKLGYKQINYNSYNQQTAEIIHGSSSNNKSNGQIGIEHYYDNFFSNQTDGNDLSKLILEINNSNSTVIHGESYNYNIYPGALITLSGNTTETHNGQVCLIEVKHKINQFMEKGENYTNTFIALPKDQSFKKRNIHKKNRILGCQTATVIGPKGQEVNCNKNGEVQVKFHWEEESCWLRVMQSWAGKGFGSLVIPRIGMEVVVTFINGDPDQPIITGCLYNGVNIPPDNYAEKGEISTFYSHTIRGDGFNEIRINDKKQEEEIFIHAQKDFNKIIENNITETINNGSKSITLESKNGHVKYESLIKDGDKRLIIHTGNYEIQIDKGNETIVLKDGNNEITLSNGDLSINVNGNINISATKNITIKAGKDIQLKAIDIEQNATKNISLNALNGTMDYTTSFKLNTLTASISCTASCSIKSTATMSLSSVGPMNLSGLPINLN